MGEDARLVNQVSVLSADRRGFFAEDAYRTTHLLDDIEDKEMSKPIITIGIPAYNQESIIGESIESALSQSGKGIEIIVVDDVSTDKTVEVVEKFPVRLFQNEYNMGIGRNLRHIMKLCDTHYIIYLCGDDLFTSPDVVGDYIKQFKANPKLGIIGRYYYQFMNGYEGAIMVSRDKNILTQSCCPSGMAFKVDDFKATNKIFIETPAIVSQYLRKGYEWTMLEYDTVKARIHPGGNTATKESYYEGSMYENWRNLTGEPLKFYQGYIQIKNRAPKKLWEEIWESLKGNKMALLDLTFWLYVTVAVVLPGCVLKPLSNFYRHRITRRFVKIIERQSK